MFPAVPHGHPKGPALGRRSVQPGHESRPFSFAEVVAGQGEASGLSVAICSPRPAVLEPRQPALVVEVSSSPGAELSVIAVLHTLVTKPGLHDREFLRFPAPEDFVS